MYDQGVGCPLDKKKALEMFQKSADLGDAHAQCHLGN